MLETKKLPSGLPWETVPCDLCGNVNLESWDAARANTLSRCPQCDVVFTNPRISSSEIKDKVIYSEGYFQQKSRMTEKLLQARRTSYRLEIDSLERWIKGGQILDVGCGMGIFLDCFGRQWERHGCDVYSYGLQEAEKRGIQVYHGEFEMLDFGKNLFDVVYFRASLHHTFSPRACLEKAHQILKPGGMVVITMSNNHSGPCGRLFKGHVKSYEQAHNYLFSTRSLDLYLRRAGFEVLQTAYPYFGTGYESWIDFFRLPILFGKYLWLKGRGHLNQEGTYDFASPDFYGNYVNIHARSLSPS